jgi:hypothetical protein
MKVNHEQLAIYIKHFPVRLRVFGLVLVWLVVLIRDLSFGC